MPISPNSSGSSSTRPRRSSPSPARDRRWTLHRGPAGLPGRPSHHPYGERHDEQRRTRRQAPPAGRTGADGPRRPDRHDHRGLHRHAGAAHGQARPGRRVPRRRHRSRCPLLHVSPGHGHGDEHARRLQADELGDRLRRLDRLAAVGLAADPAVAREDGDGPVRHHGRGDPPGDPGLAQIDPEASGGTRGGDGPDDQGGLGVRVLRAQDLVGGPAQERLGDPRTVRLLQRGLPPPAGDEGGAPPSIASQPDDRGADPDRVQQGRGVVRPTRGQHPLRPRPRIGRPQRAVQARCEGDRLPQRLGHHLHGQAGSSLDGLIRAPPHEHLGCGRREVAHPRRGRRRPLRSRSSSGTSWPG